MNLKNGVFLSRGEFVNNWANVYVLAHQNAVRRYSQTRTKLGHPLHTKWTHLLLSFRSQMSVTQVRDSVTCFTGDASHSTTRCHNALVHSLTQPWVYVHKERQHPFTGIQPWTQPPGCTSTAQARTARRIQLPTSCKITQPFSHWMRHTLMNCMTHAVETPFYNATLDARNPCERFFLGRSECSVLCEPECAGLIT